MAINALMMTNALIRSAYICEAVYVGLCGTRKAYFDPITDLLSVENSKVFFLCETAPSIVNLCILQYMMHVQYARTIQPPKSSRIRSVLPPILFHGR